MLSPITHKQFQRLQERHPAASMLELTSGAALVTVPAVPLPAGWSASSTAIHFIVPAGYPGPAPDCFWADESLTLAGGAQPQASQVNQIPETALRGRWFSWHVTDGPKNWNPNRDELMTYAAMVMDRFREVR